MQTRKGNLKRTLYTIGIVLAIVFIAIQFVEPQIDNPPIAGEFDGPPEVKQIFVRACYDCHSNKTELKWFDKIAPVSWLVASDVRKARAGLNFTEWDSLAPPLQSIKLWESYEHIAVGAMPLKNYQALHPEARLTRNEVNVLRQYLLSLSHPAVGDTSRTNALERQCSQWLKDRKNKPPLPVSSNGIQYIPVYQNWEVMTTSERFDNGTMRVIYGNAVASKAVRENNVNPWPDGTVFIKVAWGEIEDANGLVTTGEFKNFQYMIKDKAKYPDTEGWGFARFDGLERKPYGKPGFEISCINCHRAVSNNDFVFARPFKQ